MALIRFAIVVTLLATAAPSLPGTELLMGRKTELPVEKSEGEEQSVNVAVTRHRKIGVKAAGQMTCRQAANKRPCSPPSHLAPWRAPLRASNSLPNGLRAPLIC